MKNYTILPLYSQKEKKFINTYIYWFKQYIAPLDNEVWSLIDYWYQFNPDYIIFNQKNEEGNSYYSFSELKVLYRELTVGDKTYLLIYAPALLLHTGLVHDFSNFRHTTYLYGNINEGKAGDTSKGVLFEEAQIIISQKERSTEPKDYFIGRLAANNCYYIPVVFYPHTSFNFVREAEEKYGNFIRLNFYLDRFAYTTESLNLTIVNNFDTGAYPLRGKTEIGTGIEAVNHDYTLATDTNTSEKIITDDVSFQGFQSGIEKNKNPYYSINIQNGMKPFQGNIKLDIG